MKRNVIPERQPKRRIDTTPSLETDDDFASTVVLNDAEDDEPFDPEGTTVLDAPPGH